MCAHFSYFMITWKANINNFGISINRSASAAVRKSSNTIKVNMRIQSYFLICALFVICFVVRQSDAVACSTTVTTNCTDCTLAANASNTDCIATTVKPTVSPVIRRLRSRVAALQSSLAQCRRNTATLKQKIQSLTASSSSSSSSNSFKDKFFG